MAELDLILFGATGFTGKLCIKHIIEQYCNDKYSFKFGLAARNMDKLNCVLNAFDLDEKKQETYFQLIECDSFDETQIKSMISRTKVVITTIGPYCVYGEKLIALCAQNGIDYIDLTGEVHWVKSMIQKYEKHAIQSKARIVNIAGVLAALSDCLVVACVNRLTQSMDSTQSKVANFKIRTMLQPPLGARESGGSLSSIYHMYKQGALDTFYDPQFAYMLCPKDHQYGNVQPRWKRILPVWNAEIGGYEVAIWLAGDFERMVFCRSNHLLDYGYGKQAVIEESTMVFASKHYLIALLLGMLYFVLPFLMIKLTFLKRVILKCMQYTFGSPGSGEISMEEMMNARWKQYAVVQSVKDRSQKVTANVQIYGDYMYLLTAKLLVEQGMIFAMQRKATLNGGASSVKYGFLTPAVAFGEELVKRMNDLKEFDIRFQP